MQDNQMNRGTKEFNRKFAEFHHYKNHPQMMPFVGKYWNDNKKLLVIGESHYLDPGFDVEIIKDWYNFSVEELDGEDKEYAYGWTNTANIVDTTDYKPKGHTLWRNIDSAIRETGFKPTENVFCYISFYNFYQRPAEKTGNSIIITNEDKAIANETLKFIIDVIKPNYLFFVSSKAWQVFDKNTFSKDHVGHSAHPSSRWWNMKSSKYTKYFSKQAVTGKESFKDFIIYNKIFD
jgi:hypothetical protein